MSLPYKYVILTDFEFEFGGHEGNPPRPVSMVAKELRTGQEWRLWRGDFGPSPPFPVGPDALFVAFYASAELGCFRALGWPMPVNVLDLFTEFRARTNGTDWLEGRSLLAALQYFGLSTIGAEHKDQMRQLILGAAHGPRSSKPTYWNITAATYTPWNAYCLGCCRILIYRAHSNAGGTCGRRR